METGRLSFVLLVIALANLATDITPISRGWRWNSLLRRPPTTQSRCRRVLLNKRFPYSRRTRELTPPRETSRSKKRSSRMLRARAGHRASGENPGRPGCRSRNCARISASITLRGVGLVVNRWVDMLRGGTSTSGDLLVALQPSKRQ